MSMRDGSESLSLQRCKCSADLIEIWHPVWFDLIDQLKQVLQELE